MDPSPDPDAPLLVLTSFPSHDVASRIARCLVEEKRAACVSILPSATSIYAWEGDVHEETECLALLKTTQKAYSALAARLIEQHPYDTPELLVLLIAHGSPAYLEWLSKMTQA